MEQYICLENVITQYGSCLYKQRGGIVTGDNHSVSLANIIVHCILQPIADILEQTELFRRFIDDIVWVTDSESTNNGIRSSLNTVFKNNGLELTFRQICTNDGSGSRAGLRGWGGNRGNCPGPPAARGPPWWNLFVSNKILVWKISWFGSDTRIQL